MGFGIIVLGITAYFKESCLEEAALIVAWTQNEAIGNHNINIYRHEILSAGFLISSMSLLHMICT